MKMKRFVLAGLSLLTALMLMLGGAFADTELSLSEETLAELLVQVDRADGGLLAYELDAGKDMAKADGLSKDWTNLLFIGTDTHGIESDRGYGDAIIVCSVNKQTGVVKLSSISAASVCDIPGLDKPCQIGLANALGGPKLSAKTVNSVFGMNIDKYVCMNYMGFVEVVNALDGVELALNEAEAAEMSLEKYGVGEFEPGKQKMNGEQALVYCRITTTEGGTSRSGRQQTFVKTMLNAALKRNDLSELLDIFSSLLQYTSTNLTLADVMSLLPTLMKAMGDLESCSLPKAGQSATLYGAAAVMIDPEKEGEALRAFIYGE